MPSSNVVMSYSFLVHHAVLRLAAVSAPNRKSHLVLTYRACEDSNLCFVRRRRPIISSQSHLNATPANGHFAGVGLQQPFDVHPTPRHLHFAALTAIVQFISAMIARPITAQSGRTKQSHARMVVRGLRRARGLQLGLKEDSFFNVIPQIRATT